MKWNARRGHYPTLICLINHQQYKSYCYQQILTRLVDNRGTWNKEQLHCNKINFLTLRHGKKDGEHRARKIMGKSYL